VNPVEEMVNILEAQRSYESNLTVLNTAKQLALRALEIGRA
jgi:flagellar basal-body rod protein FlgC